MCLGNHGNLRNLVVDPNHSLFFTYEFYIIPSISIIRLQLPKQPTFIHQLSLLNMCFGWCVVYTSLFLLAFFWKENVFHKQLGWYHPSWLPRWSSSGASRPIRSSPSMMAFRHLSSNCAKPIGSMYGTYTYIWLIFMVNVGEYTIHGSYGKRLAETFHWKSRLVHRTGPAKKTISLQIRPCSGLDHDFWGKGKHNTWPAFKTLTWHSIILIGLYLSIYIYRTLILASYNPHILG